MNRDIINLIHDQTLASYRADVDFSLIWKEIWLFSMKGRNYQNTCQYSGIYIYKKMNKLLLKI